MPAEPTEQHRKLQALVGNWIGEDVLHPSPFFPQGGTATTKYTGHLDLNGFFVIGNHTQEPNGQVIYRAHKVFDWDAAEKQYTSYLVDSTGQNPASAARGIWEGNTLMLQQVNPTGHVCYTYTFEDGGDYLFHMEMSQNGNEWQPFIEGQCKRMEA